VERDTLRSQSRVSGSMKVVWGWAAKRCCIRSAWRRCAPLCRRYGLWSRELRACFC
jgi:hypothetical protein